MVAQIRVGVGNRSFAAAPADIFATKDGWIICQVVGKPLFRRWAALMEEPRLAGRRTLRHGRFARPAWRHHQRSHAAVVREQNKCGCAERACNGENSRRSRAAAR
nr:CoA transferase [Paraburkholderia piptadeniae]